MTSTSNINENKDNQQKNTSIVYTKLPLQWGRPNFALTGNIGIDMLSFVKLLEGNLTYKPDNLSFMYLQLFDDGYIEIPVLMDFEGVKHPFFFIYTDIEARNFLSARELLLDNGFGEPFYASSVDISNTKEKGAALRTGGAYSRFFTVKKDGLSKGEYALWWKSQEEEFFTGSKTKEYVLEMYKIFHEYETWHFGFLVQELNLSSDVKEYSRVELPEEAREIPLLGPENTDIILSVSREKGIKFLFPTSVTKAYRERLLRFLLDHIKGLHIILESHNVEKDQNKTSSLEWFAFICKHLEKTEKSENIEDAIAQVSLVKVE